MRKIIKVLIIILTLPSHNILLPQTTLDNFGGWSISKELFNYILQILPAGSTILELGSGWASGELSKNYTVYSIEHNKRWLNKYQTNYIYAPIVNNWYDTEVLKKELSLIQYDLILIDGPPGTIGRVGFYNNLNLFNTDVIMIFDDVNRPAEYNLLNNVALKLKKSFTIIKHKEKHFGIILPIE